ncbi:YcaO-like family protein [Ensifer adhaerens]|uniref:YcaO-like family protein n=1 Tax=Ensifer adhaerens TaxID=106592 RepID=UPI0009EADC59|nr:YcaO-like family protein [Ensifer adhaerens]
MVSATHPDRASESRPISGNPFTADHYSDRVCAPEETFARVAPLLPAFGISRLARLTGLDSIGIPVWNAVSPNAKSIVINQGKGITDIGAKVSAAMEALERAVACNPSAPIVHATRRTLLEKGERALTLPGLVAAGEADLSDAEPTAWLRGVDLLRQQTTFVPFHAALLDRTLERCRYWQSSDGLASGNTEGEAVLHGLLERIERDAETLWRLLPLTARLRTCIDADLFDDPIINDMTSRIATAGLTLRLFDMTSDIGIPCLSAVIADAGIRDAKEPRYHDVTIGHGAHPDPRCAAIRAITEAAQSRLTYISGARDDVFPETFTRRLPRETQQLFEASPCTRNPLAWAAGKGENALLAHVIEALMRAGISTVVAVPLLAEPLPFSVVKVFVPELENPDGARKRRFGARALSHALEIA